MPRAWRRLLTLLLALLLPLQGLAGPCGNGGHAMTAVPHASAPAVHDAGHGHGPSAAVALHSHAEHAATPAPGASGVEDRLAPAGSCSACAACCVALALPSATLRLAAPTAVETARSTVDLPTIGVVPPRLDRPPRTMAA